MCILPGNKGFPLKKRWKATWRWTGRVWTISRIIISGSVYHYSLTSSFPRNSRSFEATRRRLQALTDVYQPADNYFSCALLLIILRCVHKARADGTAAKDSKTAGISCTSLRTPECPIRVLFTRNQKKKKRKKDFRDLWKTRSKCFVSFSLSSPLFK